MAGKIPYRGASARQSSRFHDWPKPQGAVMRSSQIKYWLLGLRRQRSDCAWFWSEFDQAVFVEGADGARKWWTDADTYNLLCEMVQPRGGLGGCYRNTVDELALALVAVARLFPRGDLGDDGKQS
jgi:hypothetical protein